MYETHFLTFDVEFYSNGRKVAERIKNEKFNSYTELLESIKSKIRYNDHAVQVWSLTEFMDACNNQELNLENVWISYVHIKQQ